MRLSSLEDCPSFALLGPGFGDGQPVLLRGLREGGGSWPRLVFAPFESMGRDARVFSADTAIDAALEVDVVPEHPEITLEEAGYRDAVGRIRRAIAAGDVYQVCHTVRARVAGASGAGLFAALGSRGLAPFAAWVRLPGGPEFVSASPESFFAIDGPSIRSQPMKGTARRSDQGPLEASEKDRAELAMITDLVRNDLTPLCRPRSVRVACERRVVELPYALQTVSEVEGELLPGVGPLEALDALHPGGSVTGAPKRAALAAIRELEDQPRGPYCGALGLWREARASFSLLIRTATRQADGWIFGVGSGVVWDSDADRELDELRTKLGALR